MACVSALVIGVGCVPHATRVGAAFPLPSGPPQNGCEWANFFEVAPASTVATSVMPVGSVVLTESQQQGGTGVFHVGAKESEPIDDKLWASLREPRLQRDHKIPEERVNADSWRSLAWIGAGTLGGVAGVGTAVAVDKSSHTWADVAGFTGLGLVLVGIIGAIVAFPSGQDQRDADARQALFEKDEDTSALERGIDRMNLDVRQRCGTPGPIAAKIPPAPASTAAAASPP
jgi:hypothetical protein